VKGWLALAPIAVLASCRFGGPSANPNAYVAYDSGDDAALGDEPASEGDDAAFEPTDATVVTADGASHGDAGPPGDVAMPGDAAGTDDASTPDEASGDGGCTATVAVCDPVHNTGCNPLQQCDVDTTQTSTPTGLCVFNSGSEGGGACTMSIVSESCAPENTCVSGACRALCVCDADCPIGQCCSDTSGPPGFTLCKDCP
jgi:hypothetical protein